MQASSTWVFPSHRFRDPQTERAMTLIVVAVVLMHISLLLLSAFLPDAKPVQPPVKQIVVKTITLGAPPTTAHSKPIEKIEPISAPISEPEPVEIIEEEVVVAPPEPTPQPVEEPKEVEEVKPEQPKKTPPKPTPKKEVKKSTPKPKSKPKAKPKPKPQSKKPTKPKKEVKKTEAAPKKAPEQPKKPKDQTPSKPKVDPQVEAAKAKRRELLAKAQKSIAQIDTSDTLSAASAVTAVAAAIPGKIESLQVETFPSDGGEQLNSQERSYYDELASRLKLLLRLPEFGEVKIKLTLARSGKYVKVSIVRAESQSNRKYVEKTLPTLKYPAFGNNFSGKDQYTFVISLSNEL